MIATAQVVLQLKCRFLHILGGIKAVIIFPYSNYYKTVVPIVWCDVI